jgi:alpha-beta hydrolase superfamily lysophospholipase
VVIFGGFDSYVEEFLPLMLAFAHAGYQVVCFEGPGQGGALADAGLVLTPSGTSRSAWSWTTSAWTGWRCLAPRSVAAWRSVPPPTKRGSPG